MMLPVTYFAFLILLLLPLCHSATDICQKEFSCPSLDPFGYPFYNNDTRCGLVKVNCTKDGAEIQPGDGRTYPIIHKIGYGYVSAILIRNTTFQHLVESQKCEELMNNFTSPKPLLFTFALEPPFMTLFKCTNDTETDAYFKQKPRNYKHGRCNNHYLYYKYDDAREEVPADLPHSCVVIRLPVKFTDHKIDNRTSFFSRLSSLYSIKISLSPPCRECLKKELGCQIYNGTVLCVNAKKAAEETNRKRIRIIVPVGFACILMLSFVVFIIWHRRRGSLVSHFSSKNKLRDVEDDSAYFGVSVFSYTELENATQNFDPTQELGDGGFGAVYYGNLQDGREVAVKRLYQHNYKRLQHFMNEIEILTRLRHQNLVVLYGCTSHLSRELLLVYEYIPNGTVADHLHGERTNPSLLTWPIRMNISIETAKALVFLHATEIIHRDVKTSNLLLDHNFSVKVGDFGISRLLPNDVTHVSTAPQGTPGYVDPEYHQCYQLTDKSDVYSFGVVLIELISSMPAVDISRSRDEISLANLAIKRIQRCELDQLIDPFLGSDSNAEIEMMTTLVAELAFRCLQFNSEMRPTMNEVLEVLKEIQAQGRTMAEDAKPQLPPSPDTKDEEVLLKNHPSSPVSVTDKWYSTSS